MTRQPSLAAQAVSRGEEGLPPCVVVGLHHNGLGVARWLGRRGVPVVAIDRYVRLPHRATRYAKYVRCPDIRGHGLIDVLSHLGARLGRPAVLIPTLDRSVTLISEHRDSLERFYAHSLPGDHVVRRLMSKAGIASYALEHGFEIPRTFVIGGEKDLEACLRDLTFPCILKPQLKTDELMAHGPDKAFRISSASELRSTYQTLRRWEPRVVVQEWIPGPDTALHFCLYYFDEAGEPLVSFGGRKIRQYIPYCGTACSAEPWPDEFVRDTGIEFFRKAGYRGFGAIEFKVGPGGRYHLIEPTVGRTEHLFSLAEANGSAIVYTGYCHMAGLPLPRSVVKNLSVRYVDWSRDRRAARVYISAGDLTVIDYARSLKGPRVYPLLAWDDTGPVMAHWLGRLSGKPKRAVKPLDAFVRRQGARLLARLVPRPARSPTPTTHTHGAHRDAALAWLCAAQDATDSGGVSRAYDLRASGGPSWMSAYPETTGYIIPTLLTCAGRQSRPDLRSRALRMAEWELTIQLAGGGIQGGVVGAGSPAVVFNTGQVVLGWCAAYDETGEVRYRHAIERAARFLVSVQDDDGAWRRFSNGGGELRAQSYDVRVAWALLLACEALGTESFRNAALKNIAYTLSLQKPNGWFGFNHLSPARHATPLTHTLAYAAEGLLECGAILGDERLVAAAGRTADAALRRLHPDGFLAGEFFEDWQPAARWSCLTGTAQFAGLWLRFHRLTGRQEYLLGARTALAFLEANQDLEHVDPGVRGGIPGSYPIDARYGRFQYLNWAAKFFVDALVLLESTPVPDTAPPDGSSA